MGGLRGEREALYSRSSITTAQAVPRVAGRAAVLTWSRMFLMSEVTCSKMSGKAKRQRLKERKAGASKKSTLM